MRNIRAGTRLIFSNGKEYTVGARLGVGGTTVIYEIQGSPNSVLRLPDYRYLRVNGVANNNSELIDATVNGHSILSKLGVSTVDIKSSSPGEYVEVSRLPAKAITYGDLYYEAESIQRSAMLALADFAEGAAAFDLVGDFNEEQVAYNPTDKKAILFDWLEDRSRPWNTHQLFSEKSFANVRGSPQFQRYLRILNLRDIDGKLVGFSVGQGIAAVPLGERIAFAEQLEAKIIARRVEMRENSLFLRIREDYWSRLPPAKTPIHGIYVDDPVTTQRVPRPERAMPRPSNGAERLWANVCSLFRRISNRK